MAAPGHLAREVVCPFCGLGCDDLVVAREGRRLEVREGGCPVGGPRFEAAPLSADAAVDGSPATLAEAVARAAELLGASRRPVVGGLGGDLAAVRGALALAERVGAVVDHLGSKGLARDLRVLQDRGAWRTTLGEVRARADLLVIVGADPIPAFPRLLERCMSGPVPLTSAPRRVVRIGPPAAAGADEGETEAGALVAVESDRLPAALAALRMLVRERPAPGAGDDLPLDALGEVAAALRGARYGVVAWWASALEDPAAELVIETVLGLVRDVNLTTRCAGLPLGGADNAVGAAQACTWQTGLPLRSELARGGPVHDPLLLGVPRLVGAGEADALVWLSAFRPVSPPETTAATIHLGMPAEGAARPPAVSIPVGVPGLDHAGQIARMDGTVWLPLRALREPVLPSAGEVLERIIAALPPVAS